MAELSFERKNILVTGGAGFIGSHLCERLIREGNRVICVDNFSTGAVRNIDSLLPNPNFQFLRLDINEPFELESFPELASFKLPFQGIQEIYHLACPTSIKDFDQFKIQTLLSNSVGNYRVLELARKYRARVLLASSAVVYGPRNQEHPYVTEEDIGATLDHLSPRACYDEGRRFSETMFSTYRQVHGLEAKVARIFRTYGPRMPLNDGQLIPDFVLSAIDGEDIVVFGGKPFHTALLYVTDCVDGLIRLMAAPTEQWLVNIGSDVDHDIADVAQMILDIVGTKVGIGHDAPLTFLSELALPRLARAKELGWLPLVRLEDGLRQTIDYVKANKILLTTL
ncbi:NAD-dependent epimerase/dehydratase family protein [bacterium]|nr:NAD-dependent epimerase/dehydratase family protein [bacterium]